jgi:hypothetical protein
MVAFRSAQTLNLMAEARRPLLFSRAAAVCWLASLVLPALPSSGRTVFGFEIAGAFLIGPVAWLFAGIPSLSVLTNLVFLAQLTRVTGPRTGKLPSAGLVAACLLLNILAVAFASASGLVQGLLTRPAAWAWLLAFVLLILGILREEGAAKADSLASSEREA